MSASVLAENWHRPLSLIYLPISKSTLFAGARFLCCWLTGKKSRENPQRKNRELSRQMPKKGCVLTPNLPSCKFSEPSGLKQASRQLNTAYLPKSEARGSHNLRTARPASLQIGTDLHHASMHPLNQPPAGDGARIWRTVRKSRKPAESQIAEEPGTVQANALGKGKRKA
jgi:hypothetical protein